jgi:hypothetical protein
MVPENAANWQARGGRVVLLLMACLYPLLVFPNRYAFFERYYDYYYLPRLVVLAAAAAAALFFQAGKRIHTARKELPVLLAFLFFVMTAASLAADPVTAWLGAPYHFTGFGTYLLCVILFFLSYRYGSGEKLLPAMAACAAFVSLVALLQVTGLGAIPLEPHRQALQVHGTLGHPDYLGTFTAFMLPAAGYVYLATGRRRWLTVTALVCAGLLVSFAWGAWFGGLAGFAALAVYYFRHGDRQRLLRLTAALAAVIALFAAAAAVFGLAGQVGVVSVARFVQVWQGTVRLALHSWAFGLGPDHLVHVVTAVPSAPLAVKAPGIYLEMWVTLGIFALLSYLAFVGSVLRRSRGVLLAMIVAYLVQGLFHFEAIHLMPLFWIVLGLAAGEGITS